MFKNKKRFWATTLLLLAMHATAFAEAGVRTLKPADGYVPNADTAIKIAIAVWEPIYGKEAIAAQAPYSATLSDGIWFVTGSMPKPIRPGGTAMASIAQEDGRIVFIGHGK